jgi:DNA helicase-2/ATP-dependent DNA helicase PcrA
VLTQTAKPASLSVVAAETYILRSRGAGPLPQRTFRIDYAAELNAAQYAAATHVEGPVLVVAGAGSGKTRTLVYRVARLVELGVAPQSILLLTFTRRAAEVMLERAAALLDTDCGRVRGGTFHSFANLVLRRFAPEAGRERTFTILDRGDSEDVIQLLRTGMGLDRKERRFPKKQTIAEIFSASVNKSLPMPLVVESDYLHLADHVEDLERLRARYDAYKAQKNLLDYDDLLLKLRDLLAAHRDVAERLSTELRFVMVDEYQDTNRLQAEIVERLAATHQNVMAVGDDAQSIYSFRGADFRNIMDFERRFPGARVIALEENYRSTQPILDLANAVIERAVERYTKVLRTRLAEGEAPILAQAETENFQSRFVTQRILELREEGVPLADMAVLFRSSFHSFDLELELARADVPFVKRGGFKFVESAHVKDAIAHLRVSANPLDTVSWLRILLLLEGIGPKTAGEMVEAVAAAGGAPSALRPPPSRRPASARELERLGALLAALAAETPSPGVALERVIAHYEPILKRVHPDDHPRRQKDLEHLVTIASRYRSLEAMLADFALEPPSDAVAGVLADDADEDRLTLSTIHSAKGLEWHAVFVIWAAEGKFPAQYSVLDEAELEEERRLFYVAVTRAKRLLYVSYPIQFFERGSGPAFGRPSRFVADLPEALLRPMALVEEAF